MTEKQLRAMKDGFNACEDFLRGKVNEQFNPYLQNTEEYEYWEKGWHFCYNGE